MAFLSPSSSNIVKSLGVVFGDIGTSPIYTIGAILLFILPTVENVLGLLSLIVWSLIIVISVQYAWLAMYLGSKGEGGTDRSQRAPHLPPEKSTRDFVRVCTSPSSGLPFLLATVLSPRLSVSCQRSKASV